MAQDLTKYYEALQKADSSGDEKAAREIAEYIKSVRNQPTAPSFREKLISPEKEAFLSKLVNSLAFGIPEMLDVKTRPERKEVYEKAEQEYPTQTLAGDIAGSLPMTALGAKLGYTGVKKGLESISNQLGVKKRAEDVKNVKEAMAPAFETTNSKLQQAIKNKDMVAYEKAMDEMNLLLGISSRAMATKPTPVNFLGDVAKLGAKTAGGVVGGQTGAALTGLGGDPGSSIMRANMASESIKLPLGVIPGARNVVDPLTQMVPGALMLGSELFGPRP